MRTVKTVSHSYSVDDSSELLTLAQDPRTRFPACVTIDGMAMTFTTRDDMLMFTGAKAPARSLLKEKQSE